MGQAHTSPLALIQSHFKKFRWLIENNSLLLCPGKLTSFCKSEWPTFKVGWLEEGKFHLPTIHCVKRGHLWEARMSCSHFAVSGREPSFLVEIPLPPISGSSPPNERETRQEATHPLLTAQEEELDPPPNAPYGAPSWIQVKEGGA